MDNVSSLQYFVPELILTLGVLVVLLADIFGIENKKFDAPGLLALLTAGLAFWMHLSLYSMPVSMIFENMLAHDMFSTFFRGFFIASTCVVILMTMFSREVIYLKKGEFYAILLTVCVGMDLVAMSQDLVIIYLSLETMSLGSYMLAGFSRRVGKSEEASLKFVLYGAVSTAVMLFGLTLLYGLTGSTNFTTIQQVLASTQGSMDVIAYAIFLLIMVGVGYKIAAVPFHFWAPDVYEGSPTTITAYLSVASKGTGFALLVRLFYSTVFFEDFVNNAWMEISGIQIDWHFNIAVLSAVTMTIGNLGAIVQNNLKRLLAYSGVAHAGSLLMGIALLNEPGLQAVIFYLVMYFFTNLAAFLVVLMMVETQDDDRITGVRGLGIRAPMVAVMMTVAMFSLVGLPPTAGFVGKYYLFTAVLNQEFYWLAIIGILNTVVSLYFYARVLKAMYFEKPAHMTKLKIQPIYIGLLTVLTLPVLYFGIWWDPLVKYARYCSEMI